MGEGRDDPHARVAPFVEGKVLGAFVALGNAAPGRELGIEAPGDSRPGVQAQAATEPAVGVGKPALPRERGAADGARGEDHDRCAHLDGCARAPADRARHRGNAGGAMAIVDNPHRLDVGIDIGPGEDGLWKHHLERVFLRVIRAAEFAEAALHAADAIVLEGTATPTKRFAAAAQEIVIAVPHRGFDHLSETGESGSRSIASKAGCIAAGPAPNTPYRVAHRSRMGSGIRLHRFVL